MFVYETWRMGFSSLKSPTNYYFTSETSEFSKWKLILPSLFLTKFTVLPLIKILIFLGNQDLVL